MNPNGGVGPTPAIREAVLLDRFVFQRYYREAEFRIYPCWCPDLKTIANIAAQERDCIICER